MNGLNNLGINSEFEPLGDKWVSKKIMDREFEG